MTDRSAETAFGRSVRASGAVRAVPGALAGVAFRQVARWRRAKPLHPVGVVLHGRLLRDGLGLRAGSGSRDGSRSGVQWIDSAGDDPVLVRLSRSAGLPSWLPDVMGLAVRDGSTDLLLSSAGRAPLARHLLALRRTPACSRTAAPTGRS